ncbi:MAG TPA: proline dehydrogenase family protein [Candidatus Dormibacteraeota bacterium]|nr:proline dehydrogenase family protein [Candidatus Dormibacteraeota bacterium]
MALLERAISSPGFQERFFFLAKRFVAGETVDSAIEAVKALNADGLTATLDFLGEDVFQVDEARASAEQTLRTVEAVDRAGVDANLSLKLTALGLSIDENLAAEHVSQIAARAARNRDPFVRIDMEGSGVLDATLRAFERVYAQHRNVGIVLQSYLHRTERDVEWALGLGARVRIVKGAYKEPPSIAYKDMAEIRRSYLRAARELLTRGNYPAIATHDLSLIEAVKRMTAECGISKDRFEFQLLYGLRPETQRALVREGYRVRVYVPFGTHWAGYFYRRLAERKENVFFVLGSLLRK